MRRWSTLSGCMLAMLAVAGFPNPGHAAAGDPLLDYGADLVSDYVSRGVDLFVSKYDKDKKEHGVFNSAPAIQPYLTLHGPSGFSFGLWTSWALVDRKDEYTTDPTTGSSSRTFTGLRALDEIDYTLAWDFKNKLGGFSAGLIAYQNPNSSAQFAYDEMYVRWAMPFLASISPTITHYVVVAVPPGPARDAQAPSPPAAAGDTVSVATPPTITPGSQYTSLAFSGGEAINWKLSIGHSDYLQDITAGIGKAFGSFSVTLNGTYRPTAQAVGYNPDGSYLNYNGDKQSYPKSIYWLTFSYTGSVTE